MGYSIFMTNVRFFIAEDNKYNAYRAFKASPLASAIRVPIHSIEDTLDYFGYTAENDLEDNIIGLEHTKDKLHDEDELFFVIAPYVRSGIICGAGSAMTERWRRLLRKLNGE